jgi:predicted nucleotidyltransferase
VPVERALEGFRRGLDRLFGTRVRELRLFGSRARGDARPDSDVDVLVVLDEVTRRDFVAVTDLCADLLVEHGSLIDPHVRSAAVHERHLEEQRPLAMEIVRTGVPL